MISVPGGNSTGTGPVQVSIPIAFGGSFPHPRDPQELMIVPTVGGIWSGEVSASLPANVFMIVQFVRTGRGVCVDLENCGQFVQDESPEFITFNNESVVTSLPNGGIRTAVPTPTSKSTSSSVSRVVSTSSQTIIHTVTGIFLWQSPLMYLAVSPSDPPPSHTTEIIAGVVAGVGGLVVGIAIGAATLFYLGQRQKKSRKSSFLGPMDLAAAREGLVTEGVADGNLLSPIRPEHRTNPSPEMRGRWAGGTRYEPLNPDEGNPADGRRVATLEFQPRAGLET